MSKLIFTPPMNISERERDKSYVFLAGSIEMGIAEDWQTEMSQYFVNNNWGVFNPRRPDWDKSWVQEFKNPQFFQQVNWELDALEKCDLIILYLIPGTMSPISLLELGLHAKEKNLCVICPEGFWRKGNVDIVCHRYNIPLFNDIDSFKKYFENKFVD